MEEGKEGEMEGEEEDENEGEREGGIRKWSVEKNRLYHKEEVVASPATFPPLLSIAATHTCAAPFPRSLWII